MAADSEHQDIFRNYLDYTEDTEPPKVYHRWCFLTAVGAVLGRRAHLAHGHFRIFPTLYTMLLGEPATRKSTSIKIVKNLLASAGYENFAADKTTKEKFLVDLEGTTEEQDQGDNTYVGTRTRKYDAVTADNLWGKGADETTGEPREVFIVADEFNDFAGAGNLEFFTTLGNLWDWDNKTAPFTQRVKTTKSVSIYQPTVSILSGNTPELFSRCFPPEAIGSGFLSRMLLIHGERSGRKITFPPPPDPLLQASLVSYLRKLMTSSPGELSLTPGAIKVLDDIYQAEFKIPDIRFKAYFNRRFTQLMRVCTILAAGKFHTSIEEEDVWQANTILSHAEINMPKAMGEFGKSKNSDVANKIMELLEVATAPVNTKFLWTQVHKDLNAQKDLMDIINGLLSAEKIQHIDGRGFLPKKAARKDPKYVDWSFLTTEERDMI